MTIQYVLRSSEMTETQAEALSHLLAEMVTAADLRAELSALESRLTWRIIAVVGFCATAASILNVLVP